MTTISAEVSLSTILGHVHARADASIAVWDAPNAETPNRAFLHAAPLSPAPGGNSTAPSPAASPAAGAQFLADSQVPWGVDALGGEVSQPTWRAKPCWYLVTTEDRMIPPAAQRAMADRAGVSVSEIAASHAVYVFQPQVVAALIKQAAAAAGG